MTRQYQYLPRLSLSQARAHMQVTEGPNAGKLALLDFGLVAEVPAADREAMVSATIHLGNRDWNALIDDFIALGFLPPASDRGRIIPVMDTVLSPYLRGGGAKAFNFQVSSADLAVLPETSVLCRDGCNPGLTLRLRELVPHKSSTNRGNELERSASCSGDMRTS